MKKYFFVVLLVIAFLENSSFADNHAVYKGGLIERNTLLLNEFFSVVGAEPESTVFTFRMTEDKRVRRCATPVISEIRKNINSFSDENRKMIMEYLFEKQPEPLKRSYRKSYKISRSNTFKEAPNYYATSNFVIRWGDEAYNSATGKGVNPADDDNDDIPDLVEKWGEYLEESWNKEVNEMELKKPKSSGQYKIDIYIANTSDSKRLSLGKGNYAYTTIYSDDTPYILVNNLMPNTINDDSEGDEIGAMKVTAAHEFNHTIQYAYNMATAVWWQEATATWMEDEVFDYVNDYYQYLAEDGWGEFPGKSLTKKGMLREYGDVIWVKYLSEYYGGSGIFKDIWELCKKYSALDANKIFFKNNDTNLSKAFKDFSARNVTMSKSYKEGEHYGPVSDMMVHETYSVSESIDPISSTFFPNPPSYLGANYIKFSGGSGETLNIGFAGKKRYNFVNVKWGAVVVKIDSLGAPEVEEIILDSNQQGSVQISGFGTTYTEVYLVTTVLSKGPKNFRYGVPYSYTAELQ
ncbi:MAG: hypothetical protein A2043_05485 [Candidatus Schekmanbacteria bacterium GWA2_38_9]|uniref:Uncharacterized protein n=1 Tax=Candidatus Schekmanbacteria bacterium RIFCSPLOWO2_12_FULL_38_15 TaxID=1817883 RepID=A0A1F7SNW2_9BACT|nr:MAG: hypothetical protein A2043_05485 [Candidatus Schekmanbacteria bacterium GWA2_38_9]OGL50209.1 MAG: hypothetical protein A3H37_00420 [Candidatus Schekmanbacteria bacterium RIFCSPLOWO2_02_FULL_38_14]OGL55480.1 MAG: hypothetical protein A3G31_01580 [Candidatus Schekmanbacteria bacterium RIFCSPLOWO2_12_FULL_38_15]